MCGIAGIIQNKGEAPRAFRESLRRILDTQAHRGPDDEGLIVEDGFLLGHNRLSIIDLSERGRQPMTNEDRTIWLTFNGEIYNYKWLREELLQKGHRFSSHSDAEVIVHLYEEEGERLLKDLRGMFAFGLWDSQERSLLLARDRFGIKPLYYYFSAGRLVFASQLKALVRSGLVPKGIHESALSEFLKWGSLQGPDTFFKEVHTLQPGHYLVLKEGRLQLKRYSPLSDCQRSGQNEEFSLSALYACLEEAFKLHMVSDVPVGIFLSGGIDSSVLVALAGQIKKPIHTLTMRFKEAGWDEGPYARAVADRYGTLHHEFILGFDQFLEELPAFLEALDQPTVDGFNTYCIAKKAHELGLKVALSGLGGDELFGGYRSFQRLARLRVLTDFLSRLGQVTRNRLITALKNLGTVLAKDSWTRVESLLEGSREGYYHFLRGLFSTKEVSALVGNQALSPVEDQTGRFEKSLGFSELTQMELARYLANQLLPDTDTFGMTHSLEIRVPYLDHKWVDFVLSLPQSERWKRTKPKLALRRAFRDSLPQEILMRKKQGFTFPFDHWLRKASHRLVQESLSVGLFPNQKVLEVWKRFQAGGSHWARPWALYVASKWFEREG